MEKLPHKVHKKTGWLAYPEPGNCSHYALYNTSGKFMANVPPEMVEYSSDWEDGKSAVDALIEELEEWVFQEYIDKEEFKKAIKSHVHKTLDDFAGKIMTDKATGRFPRIMASNDWAQYVINYIEYHYK